MPLYYNKTRGPLPLSLPSGSTVVAPKSFIDISRTDEGCSSVAKYVKKGLLVAPKLRPVSEPVAAVDPAPAPPAPEPEVEPSSSDEEAESSESSSKKKSRKRTRR